MRVSTSERTMNYVILTTFAVFAIYPILSIVVAGLQPDAEAQGGLGKYGMLPPGARAAVGFAAAPCLCCGHRWRSVEVGHRQLALLAVGGMCTTPMAGVARNGGLSFVGLVVLLP